MSGSKASSKRSKNASKIQALKRAQQINELLKRSTIESEALQSGGDDRPVGEQHIFDLLEEDRNERKLQNIVSKSPVLRRRNSSKRSAKRNLSVKKHKSNRRR
jgi:hypothetical protein